MTFLVEFFYTSAQNTFFLYERTCMAKNTETLMEIEYKELESKSNWISQHTWGNKLGKTKNSRLDILL